MKILNPAGVELSVSDEKGEHFIKYFGYKPVPVEDEPKPEPKKPRNTKTN